MSISTIPWDYPSYKFGGHVLRHVSPFTCILNNSAILKVFKVVLHAVADSAAELAAVLCDLSNIARSKGVKM